MGGRCIASTLSVGVPSKFRKYKIHWRLQINNRGITDIIGSILPIELNKHPKRPPACSLPPPHAAGQTPTIASYRGSPIVLALSPQSPLERNARGKPAEHGRQRARASESIRVCICAPSRHTRPDANISCALHRFPSAFRDVPSRARSGRGSVQQFHGRWLAGWERTAGMVESAVGISIRVGSLFCRSLRCVFWAWRALG
ncbi:hypothetical protein BJ912DRAFT_565501 [Pholiota molesta]|nr:hypothetical protein BJ912DRAFT_565501 [Pholiota molesta]